MEKLENSFFEYRDETGVGSDSESEFIDNSMDESIAPKKTPAKRNQTAFIPESDDSKTGGESEEENALTHLSKSVSRRSSAKVHHIVLSSDDDQSKNGSIRRQSGSSNKVVFSSSEDEGQVSPEIIPRRRLPLKTTLTSSDSFIGRKTKKRIMCLDSDTDNSIIIERDKNRKLACLKDTPLKIGGLKENKRDIKNMSIQSNESNHSSDEEEQDSDKSENSVENVDNCQETVGQSSDSKSKKDNEDNIPNSEPGEETYYDDEQNDKSDGQNRINTSDDGLDEDQMVMSHATRMSIMGIIPKENDSDDSDYIQSDDTPQVSRRNSLSSSSDPQILESNSPNTEAVDGDTSKITCSPISSPLQDITNEINNSIKNDFNISNKSNSSNTKTSTGSECNDSKLRSLNSSKDIKMKSIEKVIDDDLTMIDMKPEIIALSSDDEDEVKDEKKSQNSKKSQSIKNEEKAKRVDSNIKQYMLPQSYPNQVVYVKKHVRETELNKLNVLRDQLQGIRILLETMDVNTLPDGGVKLIERLTSLEAQVRLQGDKVANMVVEPDVPTPKDIARDGFSTENNGLSWDEIQKASNAVQPRMFGKQAMATHMAERNLIQERLRALYAALESRPAEGAAAAAPAALRATLLPHQRHALLWLRWREAQRPRGGLLGGYAFFLMFGNVGIADDMGLGKTITMIALVLSDKESSIDNDDDEDYHDKKRMVKGGTLVVCPASLMAQWAAEVRKHCAPHALGVALHHGAARAAQPQRLAAHDLVLTTYHILQRESEKNGVLTRVLWRRVILDEAHAVRNHKSATSGAVCALAARRRWALTGTPLHNKDLDLFALLKFLKCTPFDDLKMWQKWIDNKSIGGQERLSIIMQCLMLRRTKAQLQERGQLQCLPPRDLHEKEVTLDKEEMNVYQKVLVFSKTLFAQFLHQRAEKAADAQGFLAAGKDSEYDKVHKKMIALQGAKPVKSHEILVLLLRLRQVCCHCGLIAGMLDADADADAARDAGSQDLLAELNKLTLNESRRKSGGNKEEDEDEEQDESEGTSVAEAIRTVLSPNNPVFDLQNPSSKIKAVMDCLNENVISHKGRKAVVVSQWTSVLALVARELAAARVRCVTLSGAVPVAARARLVDQLNDTASDVRVMLLSLCAGGVGLNLCGASHLLLLDPHWNPQLEEQAQDRIYRVGQTQHVHIYRFMCVDTVEQSIRQLQKAKLALADSVLTGAKNTNASKLTIEDLKMLFNMGPQSIA
ncbi:unnamed protein product, partial [Brenthis ino]